MNTIILERKQKGCGGMYGNSGAALHVSILPVWGVLNSQDWLPVS